jgi:hypothetical protein
MPKTAMSSMKSSIPCGNFLAGWQEVTTKSTKAAKGDENVYEDSIVVKLIFGYGRTPRCALRGK